MVSGSRAKRRCVTRYRWLARDRRALRNGGRLRLVVVPLPWVLVRPRRVLRVSSRAQARAGWTSQREQQTQGHRTNQGAIGFRDWPWPQLTLGQRSVASPLWADTADTESTSRDDIKPSAMP